MMTVTFGNNLFLFGCGRVIFRFGRCCGGIVIVSREEGAVVSQPDNNVCIIMSLFDEIIMIMSSHKILMKPPVILEAHQLSINELNSS